MIKLIHAVIVETNHYREGMTFNEAAEGDYIWHAIFDINKDLCIFHNNNIHKEPNQFLQGIELGAHLANTSIDITKIVLPLQTDEMKSNFIDVCTALRRWVGENLD